MTLLIFVRDDIRYAKAGEPVEVEEPLAAQLIASGQAYRAEELARHAFRKKVQQQAAAEKAEKREQRYRRAFDEIPEGSDPPSRRPAKKARRRTRVESDRPRADAD